MYKKILVALDNSSCAKSAEELSPELAKIFQAEITGFHVYSGRFHKIRFEVLEDYLPEKYQKEEILDYQRRIHSILIKRGLELISFEYMKRLADRCAQLNLKFSEKVVDGKNSDKIIDESSSYDLVVVGARGQGLDDDHIGLGSVTRRVLQHAACDLLLVQKPNLIKSIMIGIDGGEYARQVLEKGLIIAQQLGAAVQVVTSFDPGLHPVVFQNLAKVLSEEGNAVFRFKDQEALHNMVTDKSLEDLYQGYLSDAVNLAQKYGIAINTTLLTGKPYRGIVEQAAKTTPDLVILGRYGAHHGRHDTIGSNVERTAELIQSNLLIVNVPNEPLSTNSPEDVSDKQALYGEVTWSDEAKKRLENIPSFARPMAILAIERYAKENGISTITPSIMKLARGDMEDDNRN